MAKSKSLLPPNSDREVNMKALSENEKEKLWNEVCRECPDDLTLQEVHFARLVHYEMFKDISDQEKIDFYRQAGNRHPKMAGNP